MQQRQTIERRAVPEGADSLILSKLEPACKACTAKREKEVPLLAMFVATGRIAIEEAALVLAEQTPCDKHCSS